MSTRSYTVFACQTIYLFLKAVGSVPVSWETVGAQGTLMGWKTGWFGALLLGGLLAACASVPPPPPTPEPVRPPPEPRPPYGAALNLPVPYPGPDVQFATVNSGIGPKETIWHLRAALNVAALACGDGKAITSAYNRFLADRKRVLKKAWAAETSRHGRATLDRHMTLLYNYFAQPPALPGFCRAASAEVIRDRKSTRLNSSHSCAPRMTSSA